MDIVNVIATASIALSNMVQPVVAEGIINTNTKTNIKEESTVATEEINKEENKSRIVAEKTEEELKNDIILANWRKKQEEKWENLPVEKFIVNASAYTAAADECGWNTGITSSGIKVKENRTLACPKEFPFGTIIEIEGMGQYRCEDRGGAIKGNKVDIYMETKKDAFQFGRKNLIAWVINP